MNTCLQGHFPAPPRGVFRHIRRRCVLRRALAAWLACLAVLFAAVWPTIASVRAPERGTAVVLCAPTGPRSLVVDLTGQPVHELPAGAHCPLCSGPLDHAWPMRPASLALGSRLEPVVPAIRHESQAAPIAAFVPPSRAPPVPPRDV